MHSRTPNQSASRRWTLWARTGVLTAVFLMLLAAPSSLAQGTADHERLSQAETLIALGAYEQALEELASLHARYPQWRRVIANMGLALTRAGWTQDAKRWTRFELSLNPPPEIVRILTQRLAALEAQRPGDGTGAEPPPGQSAAIAAQSPTTRIDVGLTTGLSSNVNGGTTQDEVELLGIVFEPLADSAPQPGLEGQLRLNAQHQRPNVFGTGLDATLFLAPRIQFRSTLGENGFGSPGLAVEATQLGLQLKDEKTSYELAIWQNGELSMLSPRLSVNRQLFAPREAGSVWGQAAVTARWADGQFTGYTTQLGGQWSMTFDPQHGLAGGAALIRQGDLSPLSRFWGGNLSARWHNRVDAPLVGPLQAQLWSSVLLRRFDQNIANSQGRYDALWELGGALALAEGAQDWRPQLSWRYQQNFSTHALFRQNNLSVGLGLVNRF